MIYLKQNIQSLVHMLTLRQNNQIFLIKKEVFRIEAKRLDVTITESKFSLCIGYDECPSVITNDSIFPSSSM